MNRRSLVLLATAALALTGCSTDGGTTAGTAINRTAEVTTPTVADDGLPNFDACDALGPEFRQAHDLDGIAPRPFTDTVSEYHWRGCEYQRENYIGVAVGVTNSTVDDALSRSYTGTTELDINGLRAVYFHVNPEQRKTCTLFVTITGGSLYVSGVVPDLRSTAGIDPCQTAIDAATSVEPLLPK